MTDLASKRATHGMPRAVLIFAAVLAAVTIAGAWSARQTGFGRIAPPAALAVESLSLLFDDQPDGSVVVRRAGDGATIYRIAPETNGFIRATVRGLVQERRRSDVGAETPFVLNRWSDGRITLDDSTTGRTVPLEAFGHTNVDAFAQLFQASGAVR